MAGLENGNLAYLNFTGIAPIFLADGTELEVGGYEFSLILTPLTPGEHVIQMKAKGSFDFATDVTYHLTVQAGPK